MAKDKAYIRISRLMIGISLILVICGTFVFALSASRTGLVKNIENRALSELRSTANMQESAMMDILEEQFLHLKELSGSMAGGDAFANPAIRPLLRSAVETYEFCMLGFADINGDVINYRGEDFGNIRDRAYFYEIIDGTADRKCEYLATTKSGNSPRIMFSVPVYRGGEIIGVLFCSKEIDVLENTIFQDTDLFDPSASIFVCDAAGNLIVGNVHAHEELNEGSSDAGEGNVFEQYPALADVQTTRTVSENIRLEDLNTYMAAAPLSINGWTLYCILDELSAAKTFDVDLAIIKGTFRTVVLAFLMALAYVLLWIFAYILQKNSNTRRLQRSYENYKQLLHEMNCTVLEYIPTTNAVQFIQDVMNIYNFSTIQDGEETYEAYKRKHPEFDFEELEKGLNLTIQNCQTHTLESMLIGTDGKYHWMRVILVPIADENAAVSRVFAVALDNSSMHDEFESIFDTVSQVQSGICRCRLNEPRLEYYNDGLCRMLGYTYPELQTLVSRKDLYAQLIHPEDRQIFWDFVRKRSAAEGVSSCEYRMACKNGDLLPVADTMDTRRNSLGDMYGYSVITDIQKYKQLQESAKQELEKMQQQLEWLRIKNSTSQMQPHFLYNALASIREIVLEDPEYASSLLYDFTTHLRACIRSMSNGDPIPFTQELENIKAYVRIEQARFGEKLKVEYQCSETNFKIMPLSVQPLVENAIRHGVYERGAAGGTVEIRSWRTNDNIVVQVEDNGVGFDVDAVFEEVRVGKRDSTGIMNLKYRFENVMRAKVDIKSQLNEGTCITVTIPEGGEK